MADGTASGEPTPDRSAPGHVASVTAISMANRQLRERLLASEERYRSIFAASPDAILVVTHDGQITDANDAATRLFRADIAWLVGRHAADLAAVDLSSVRPRTDALAPGESLRLRPTAVRRDGATFPADVEVAAVNLDGARRYLVRVRDLTDQERLQAELVQAQKMDAIGRLVSGVAHELNNPLAAIILSSELIRRDAALPEDLRHNADLLVEEATRTKRIVQNLLDFARQRPPERHPTPIPALIESVLTLQSYSLGSNGILVEVEVADDLPLVELDRGQLQQVLVNLTHNAIYAIRDGSGSRIRITAAPEGPIDAPRVRVTVMDDGTGVPPEVVDRLFEPFFTTKPPADGTGLGLSVSYGIVKSHGGELRYTPSALGRGAAFTFDLPVNAIADTLDTSSPFPTTAAEGPAEGPGTAWNAEGIVKADRDRRTVLVLDDEPSIRVFLVKALNALGYDPVVAEDGPAAIALGKGGQYHAVLCDHQMPDMSGIEVYEAMVATDASLAGRFVMMSGDVLNTALGAFASSHDVVVMAKPFDLETLRRTLREVGSAQPRG